MLSIVFLYFALDESTSIHEEFDYVLSIVEPTGVFYHRWVVGGIIFVSALAIIFRSFVRDLLPKDKRLFLVSLGIFFSGSIGVEMIAGWYKSNYQVEWHMNISLSAFEESLEMGGIILFIHFLLTYISKRYPKLRLSLMEAGRGAKNNI